MLTDDDWVVACWMAWCHTCGGTSGISFKAFRDIVPTQGDREVPLYIH